MRYNIWFYGCREASLNGLYGIVLGAYIAGCGLNREEPCTKLICSHDHLEEPGARRIVLHNGWGRGSEGIHVVYGVKADPSEAGEIFYRASGFNTGYLVNIPLGRKYYSALVDGGEVAEIHIHPYKLPLGLIAGFIGCRTCYTSDLHRIFDDMVDYFGLIGDYNYDPLYYLRAKAMATIEIERLTKYSERLLSSCTSLLNELITATAILASKASYGDTVVSTTLFRVGKKIFSITPPMISSSIDDITSYLRDNSGSLLYIYNSVDEALRNKIVSQGLRILDLDGKTIVWANSLKKLILSLEKICVEW